MFYLTARAFTLVKMFCNFGLKISNFRVFETIMVRVTEVGFSVDAFNRLQLPA